MDKKDLKKFILEVAFFLVVMIATWQAFFSSQDFGEIGKALQEMEPLALLGTVILSVLFVCGEGYMIWYLMHGLESDAGCTSVLSIPLWDFSSRALPRRPPAASPCSSIV